MTKEEAMREVNKAFEPAYANYIITALTEGATTSDKDEKQVVINIPKEQYSLIMQSHRSDIERFVSKEAMMYAIKNGTPLSAYKDCVSRQAVLDMATTIQTDDYNGNEAMEVVDVDDVRALPPVTPERETGKWIDTGEISTNRRGQIVHEVICSECNGISYFRSMGNKYIGANLCPNCGSRNCQERLKGESNGSN